MVKISAFADEVSPDLDEQIAILQANDVQYIELRSVWNRNVLDLTKEEITAIKRRANSNGIGFSAVGSPLGKYPIDGVIADQLDGLRTALEYAQILEAPYIRIFSFYLPEDESQQKYRAQVIDWLGQMIRMAEGTGVTLAHENEKLIYGDTGERCLDLYTTLQSPAFTGIFDFANFVQCEQRPYHDCWKILQPHITYFHVKDALWETGQVVPAGQGDGYVETILGEAFSAGFDNFLTLEPHLSLAEATYGRTTPELFHTAAQALQTILGNLHLPK